MAKDLAVETKYTLPRMKSVERISKLPAVEQTVDMANNLYVKVKDTNNLVKTVLNTAETTVKGAVDITLPVTSKFEKPIKMMDNILCSSLDYVETKIPAVKLPLDQMYTKTRDSLYTIPGIRCACQAGEQGMKKAVEIAYGASQLGTQKLKDVKDCFSVPASSEADPNISFGAKYSLTAKRLLSLLISWFRITSPVVPESTPLQSVGKNSISDKKESEPQPDNGVISAANSSRVFLDAEKGNCVPSHTESE